VTITYRFEKPNQVERGVPMQECLATPIRIPVAPETVGDHIRLRRLKLKLLEKQIAERLGVHKATVHNWEANLTQPAFEYMPAVIEFLGYNPLPPAKTWAGRLVRGRTLLGLSQGQMARQLGVDPSTLARWERGEREPTGAFEIRAQQLLTGAENMPKPVRQAG